MSDGVDADFGVSVSRKEGGAVSGPAEAGAVGSHSALADRDLALLKPDLVDDDLGLEVPDLDALLGGSAEPVSVGAKDEGVDDVASFETVESLAFVEVPEHGSAVLASGSAEGAVGGNGDGVQIASVANKVGEELARGEVPDLDELVPAARHDEGLGRRRGKAHAGNPLGVAILVDGELALSEGVPELDALIAGSRNDLPVVRRKGDGEHIFLVSDKTAGGVASIEVPEAEGAVPGSREGELTIRRDDDIFDEVAVSLEGAAGKTVVSLLAGKLPDDHRLVTGRRENHVGVLVRGGDRRHPSFVAIELTAERKLFTHFAVWFLLEKRR